MKIIERILCKLIPYLDIGDDATGEVYLRRWFIYPRHPKNDKGSHRLYLHKFYRGDQDIDLHDHPWKFTSLILKGGYWEHRVAPRFAASVAQFGYEAAAQTHADQTIRTWYGPFSYLKRGARWTHRVELPAGKTAWTLVLTGIKERSWGFHTKGGWCPWRNYKAGTCWCEEEKEQP